MNKFQRNNSIQMRYRKILLLVFSVIGIYIFSGNVYAQNLRVGVPRVAVYESDAIVPAMLQGLGFFTHSSGYDMLNLTDILNDQHLNYDVFIIPDRTGNNIFPRYINDSLWQKLIDFQESHKGGIYVEYHVGLYNATGFLMGAGWNFSAYKRVFGVNSIGAGNTSELVTIFNKSHPVTENFGIDGNWTIGLSSDLVAKSLNLNSIILANYSNDSFNLIAYNNPNGGRAVWNGNELIRLIARQPSAYGSDPIKVIDILTKDIIFWLADYDTKNKILVPGHWDGFKIYNATFVQRFDDNVGRDDLRQPFESFLNESGIPVTIYVITRALGSGGPALMVAPEYYKNLSSKFDIEYGAHGRLHWCAPTEPERELEVNQSAEDIKTVFGYYPSSWVSPGYCRGTEPYVDKYPYFVLSIRLGGIPYPSMWDWHTCCWISAVSEDRVLRTSRSVAVDDAKPVSPLHFSAWRTEFAWKKLRHFALVTESHAVNVNSTMWQYYRDYALWVKNFTDVWITHASKIGMHALTRRAVEYINGTFNGSVFSLTVKLQKNVPFLPLLFSDKIKSVTIDDKPHFGFKDNMVILPSLELGAHELSIVIGEPQVPHLIGFTPYLIRVPINGSARTRLNSVNFTNQCLTVALGVPNGKNLTVNIHTTNYTPIYVINTTFNLTKDFNETNKILTVNAAHSSKETITVCFKNETLVPFEVSIQAVDQNTKLTNVGYDNVTKQFSFTITGTGYNKTIVVFYNITPNFNVYDSNLIPVIEVRNNQVTITRNNYSANFNSSTKLLIITIPVLSERNITISPSLADGSFCLVHNDCTNGFCVHGICRSTPTYCGDGYCDQAETYLTCPADCPAPPKQKIEIETEPSKGLVYLNLIRANELTTVSFERRKDLNIFELNILVKDRVSNVKINITKLVEKPAEVLKLPVEVYGYFNFTTNIEPNNIDKAKIKFLVETSWIDANINPDTIALYRFSENKWNKLPTVKISEDEDYVYFEAETPGFSYFAIGGEKIVAKECPVCPDPTEWSECVDNKQTRTNYQCSEATNYTCQPYEETRYCEIPEEIKPWYYIFYKWYTWVVIGLIVFIIVVWPKPLIRI